MQEDQTLTTPPGEKTMSKTLTALLASLLLALATATPASADERPHKHSHEHDHHHGAAQPEKLSLNAGQQWPTDAPLRQSMAEIRQELAGKLESIHAHRLNAAGYTTLAKKVEAEVGKIVGNCHLEPAADAQLHLIVADLLAASKQMAGKQQRETGAIKLVQTLNNYATYFADPGFKPLSH